MGILVQHISWADEDMPAPNHVPSPTEMGGNADFWVGPPMGLKVGEANKEERDAVRARTTAANALEAAKLRFREYGVPVDDVISLSFSAPVPRSRIATPPTLPVTGGVLASGSGTDRGERGESGPRSAGESARGGRTGPTVVLGATTGPRKEGRTEAGRGGGVPPTADTSGESAPHEAEAGSAGAQHPVPEPAEA